jgi:Domain of unknown function (DUF4386)
MVQDPFPRSLAVLAGLLYLVIILAGMGTELGVRGAVVVRGDAAATAAGIAAHAVLFRLGFLAETAMVLADAALAVLLYRMLALAGPLLSLTAMVFRLIQSAILALNLMHPFSALLLATGGADPAAVLLEMTLQAHVCDLGLIFFGVNCVLTGLLLMRLPAAPSLLGGGILASGLVYLTGSALRFIAPALRQLAEPAYLLPLLAETAFCLWLLFRAGERLQR